MNRLHNNVCNRSFSSTLTVNGRGGFHTAVAIAFLLILAAISFHGHASDGGIVQQGTWTKKTASINGSWRIVEENGRLFLELDEDFKTKKAPDLKAFLSPRPLSGLRGATAIQGATLIGALSSQKGKQRLALPATVNLSDFRSLIIHCEKYDKLWGGAELK